MIREISAMDARKNFGEILNEVKYRHDSVLIKKAGKPIAAIIDVDLFEKVKNMKLTFESLTHQLAHTYTEAATDIAQTEIEEAITSARKSNQKHENRF